MIFTRKYGVLLDNAHAIYLPMIKRAAVDFALAADWTPAAGDVLVMIDGNTPANITNLPTAITIGNTAFWKFILTAAELTGKVIAVSIADAAAKAIEDNGFLVETFGHASAFFPSDLGADNTDVESRLQAGAKTIIKGVVGTGSTTTSVVTSSLDPAATATSQMLGQIVFSADTTTSALRGVRADITASTAGGVLTISSPLPAAPANGDTFVIV